VTEFYEGGYTRQWFTDAELERFKGETVALAKQYLVAHPDQVAEYSRPVLDPVTGTYRKKALFSIPVLGATDADEMMETSKDRDIKKQLLELEVKKILVVDRNKLVLDLFRRSLAVLFPHASTTAVQTGEEALSLVEAALSEGPRGFDIVVAEERLHRPLLSSSLLKDGGKSCGQLESLSANRSGSSDTQFLPLVKQDSMTEVDAPSFQQWTGISGSELFRRIVDLEDTVECCSAAEPAVVETVAEDDVTGASKHQLESNELLSLSDQVVSCWRSLLIGVSTHPDQDANTFLDSGADVVWGKPPPRMNVCLRDQIVSALVMKRKAGRLPLKWS
jgi:CheY-like chemotaxis protein